MVKQQQAPLVGRSAGSFIFVVRIPPSTVIFFVSGRVNNPKCAGRNHNEQKNTNSKNQNIEQTNKRKNKMTLALSGRKRRWCAQKAGG
jgi:hypothetical protein